MSRAHPVTAPHAAGPRTGARERLRGAAGRLSPEAWGVVALTIGFIAFTAWWLVADTRPPDNDGSKHVNIGWNFYEGFRRGDLTYWWRAYSNYPPLAHTVAAVSQLFAGKGAIQTILSTNVFFVPLLAAGTYLTGKVAFGRRAGLLAALFALTTPMILSQFHSFMTDPPLTAMVALSVGLLLASDRFGKLGWSAAAGVAMGLGMMTKSPFPVFVAGLIPVMLLRGGWRNWRGVLIAGGLAALIAGPWYLHKWDHLFGATTGSVVSQGAVWYNGIGYSDRWTEENFAWYGWNAINNQFYVPLLIFFCIGLAFAVWRWARRREDIGYIPELLVGGFVSWFVISSLVLDDPRYSLPALVYVAALGTGWLTSLRRRGVRNAAIAAFVLLCAVNTISQATDIFGRKPVRLTFAGAPHSPIGEREFTFFSSAGYGEGAPDREYRLADYLRAARDDGVRHVGLGGGPIGFFVIDMIVQEVPGITQGIDVRKMGRDDLFILYQGTPAHVPPCTRLFDGTGLYFKRGTSPPRPEPELPVTCFPPKDG